MITFKFKNQLRCIGHFLENDKWNGKKWFDETYFAILLKAIDHGMKEFTIKVFLLLFFLQLIQILDWTRRYQSWQLEACSLIQMDKTKRRRHRIFSPNFINARRLIVKIKKSQKIKAEKCDSKQDANLWTRLMVSNENPSVSTRRIQICSTNNLSCGQRFLEENLFSIDTTLL